MTIVSTSAPKRRRYPKRRPQPAISAAIVSPAPLRKRQRRPEVRIAEEKPAKATAISVLRIVTAKPKRMTRFGPVQEIDAEEHRRRGDAAVALFKELVRRAAWNAGS
jgi:hypothetical protein